MRSAVSSMTEIGRRPDSRLVGGNIVGLVLGLASATLQARLLGPDGRGEIAIAIAPATVIAMLMCFGLPDYLSRQAARGAAVNGLAAVAALLSVGIGVVCALPYALFVVHQTEPGTAARTILIVYAAVSPLLVFGYCMSAVCAGSDRWDVITVSRFLPQASALAGLAAMSIVGGDALGVGLLLVAASVAGAVYPTARTLIRPRARPRAVELTSALGFGLRAWPAGATALVNQRVDLLLLTVLAAPTQLGLYAVATTMAGVLTAFSNSLAMPVRNRVARGESAIVPAASSAATAVVLLVALVLIALLTPLIQLILGPAFLPARGAMIILLLAQVPLACVVVLTQSLIGAGLPSAPLGGEIAALAATTVLVLLLHPGLGIQGVAYANLAGNLISLCVLLHLVRRVVGPVPLWRFLIPTTSSVAVLRRSR